VDLKGGRGGLQHDVILLCVHFVTAGHVQVQGLKITRHQHLVVQGLVTGHCRHVLQGQVRLAQVVQDADHDDFFATGGRGFVTPAPGGQQPLVHAVKDIAGDGGRWAVDLEVEGSQFRHDIGIIERPEKGGVFWRGMIAGIQQPGFQLEPGHVTGIGKTPGCKPLPPQGGFIL